MDSSEGLDEFCFPGKPFLNEYRGVRFPSLISFRVFDDGLWHPHHRAVVGYLDSFLGDAMDVASFEFDVFRLSFSPSHISPRFGFSRAARLGAIVFSAFGGSIASGLSPSSSNTGILPDLSGERSDTVLVSLPAVPEGSLRVLEMVD